MAGTLALDLANTALLLIDVQSGIGHPTHWGHQRSNPSFERNFDAMLSAFRKANEPRPAETRVPIIHIQHSSTSPSSPLHASKPGFDFFHFSKPRPDCGELALVKKTSSAFVGTGLECRLAELGHGNFRTLGTLFVAGLTLDHCVSSSLRMASDLVVARRVVLVGDATALWVKGRVDADVAHEVHLDSLRSEFCETMSTEQVVAMVQDAASRD